MAGGTPSHLLSLGEAGLVGGLEQGLHPQGVTEQVGRACLSQTGLKHGSDLARFSEACCWGWTLPEQAQDGHRDQKGGEGQTVASGVANLHRTVEHFQLLLEGGG